MKIELWYDAAAQETDILINDVPVEKNDVYGFLYPVRNYPIQSWLYPNGSWKGIEYQITDLARDEDVDLVFHEENAITMMFANAFRRTIRLS